MSDEERFLDEDVTGEEETGEIGKPGVVPGFLLTVLKWAAIGLAAVILIATVSYLTVTLFIKGRTPVGPPAFSPEYQPAQAPMEYFKNMLDSVRGQTSDDPPKSFLVSVSIGYEKGNAKIQTKLIENSERIQNLILKYFGQKKSNELITKNFEELEIDLKTILINRLNLEIKTVLIHELQTF